jgi:Fe-S-cluster containining protein
MTGDRTDKKSGPETVEISGEHAVAQNLAEENLWSSLLKIEEDLKHVTSDFYSEKDYKALMKILLKRMPVIYSKYEDYLRIQILQLKEKVRCFKGCNSCCVHNVTSVEPFEIIYLDWHIKRFPEYCSLLVQLFQRQAEFEKLADAEDDYDEDVVLYKYFLKNFACPFLSAGHGCSIYDKRPIPCRMFFSLSEPKTCVGTRTIKSDNKNFIIELPDEMEVLISQIGLLFKPLKIPQFLFSGLLRVNELFGKFS